MTDDMNFETLQRLVIEDGYASTYILQPALQGRPDEVFYTIWNYERLQCRWAKEHGLNTSNLDEIKLAQIEEYKPDVFYNLSAYYDGGFINQFGSKKSNMKCVYWNGIVDPQPRTFLEYDGQLSLHRPHIEYWRTRGLAACELQPGIPVAWKKFEDPHKTIDVIFYGQFQKTFFGNRNRLVEDLLHYKLASGRDIRCHLTYSEYRPTIFRIPKLRWTRIESPWVTFPSKTVRENSLPALYGEPLYEAVAQAKIVVNAYTDENRDFKSNMRLFEAIGLGAFLISEEGVYPDGFEPGVDFYTYKDSKGLMEQIERVLADWPTHADIARRSQQKICKLFSKKRQWNDFQEFVSSL